MASIIVPQIEIKRIVELILEQYNEQYNVQQAALTADDVSSVFVVPREEYKNAIEIRTNDLTDALVFKVNIDYTLSDKPSVSPFRLEVLENMDNGDGSKVYIGMAKLPRSVFPTASKYVFDPIHEVGLLTFGRPGYSTSIVTVQRLFGNMGEVSVDIYHEEDLLGTVTFADGDSTDKTFDTELDVETIVYLTNTAPPGILGNITRSTVLKPVPVPSVVWTAAVQDFVVAEGSTYAPSLKRSFNSGEITVNVSVAIDNDTPYDTTATFAFGSLTATLSLTAEELPHAYEATILPGTGYTVGVLDTVNGTVTEQVVPSPGVLGFVSASGFCNNVVVGRVGGAVGTVSVGVYVSVNNVPGTLIQTLTWTNGDTANKTINVCSVSQHDAMVLVLSNPVNATIDPTKQTQTLVANGVIEFVADEMQCGNLGVLRAGPANGTASATVYRENAQIEGVVTWTHMETGIKSLDVCPYIEGNSGSAVMTLGNITGAPAGDRLSATVTSGAVADRSVRINVNGMWMTAEGTLSATFEDALKIPIFNSLSIPDEAAGTYNFGLRSSSNDAIASAIFERVHDATPPSGAPPADNWPVETWDTLHGDGNVIDANTVMLDSGSIDTVNSILAENVNPPIYLEYHISEFTQTGTASNFEEFPLILFMDCFWNYDLAESNKIEPHVQFSIVGSDIQISKLRTVNFGNDSEYSYLGTFPLSSLPLKVGFYVEGNGGDEAPPDGHYEVSITIYPLDAEVVVRDSNDDIVEPESPGVYSLLPGNYTLYASADGYQSLVQEFTVSNSNLVIEESLVEELVFTPVPMNFVPSAFTPISDNSTWEKRDDFTVRFTKTYLGTIADLGSTILAFNFNAVPELSDFYVEFTIANYEFNKTGGNAVSPPPFVADISFYQQLSGTPTANVINTFSEAGGLFSVTSNMSPESTQAASTAEATPKHVGLYVSGGYYKVWHEDAGWVTGENTYTSSIDNAAWFGEGHVPAYFFMGVRTDSTTDNQGTASLDIVIVNGADVSFANNDPLLVGTGVERLVLGTVQSQVSEICEVALSDSFTGTGDLIGHMPEIGNVWITDFYNPLPSPILIDEEIASGKVLFGNVPQSDEDLGPQNHRSAGSWLVETASERQYTQVVYKTELIIPGISFTSSNTEFAYCYYTNSFFKAQNNTEEYFGDLELFVFKNLTTGIIGIRVTVFDIYDIVATVEKLYSNPVGQERTFDIEVRFDSEKLILLVDQVEVERVTKFIPLPSRAVMYSQFTGSYGIQSTHFETMLCSGSEQSGTVSFGPSPQYASTVNAARQAGASGQVSVDIVFENNTIHTFTWNDGEQGIKEIDLSSIVNSGDTLFLQNASGDLVINPDANEITLETEDVETDLLRFDKYAIDSSSPAQEMVFDNGDKSVVISGTGSTELVMHTTPNKFTGDCYQELTLMSLPRIPETQNDIIATGVELGDIILSVTNAQGDGSQYAIILQYVDETDTQVTYQIGSTGSISGGLESYPPVTFMIYTNPETLTRKIGFNGQWYDHVYNDLNDFQYAASVPVGVSSQLDFTTAIFVSEEGTGLDSGLEYAWSITGAADEISYISPGTVYDNQNTPNGPGKITFIADQFTGTLVGAARVLGNEGSIAAEVVCEGSTEVNTDVSWDDGFNENIITLSVEDNFGDRTGNVLTLQNPTGGATIGIYPETEWFQNYPSITFASDSDAVTFGNPANPKTLSLEVKREGGLKLQSRVKWNLLSVTSPAILAQFEPLEGEITFYIDEDTAYIEITKTSGDNLASAPSGWNGGSAVVVISDPVNAEIGTHPTQTFTCNFLF